MKESQGNVQPTRRGRQSLGHFDSNVLVSPLSSTGKPELNACQPFQPGWNEVWPLCYPSSLCGPRLGICLVLPCFMTRSTFAKFPLLISNQENCTSFALCLAPANTDQASCWLLVLCWLGGFICYFPDSSN